MFLKSLLGLFIKDVVQDAQRRTVSSNAQNAVRVEFLRHVTEGFTREISFNISQYVRSLGEMKAEIESENEGEQLFYKIQSALKSLEVELEELGPESPVAQYLIRKYGEAEQSYVGRATMSVAAIIATGPPDPSPWLNRAVESQPVQDMISAEAARLLDRLLSQSTSNPYSDFL